MKQCMNNPRFSKFLACLILSSIFIFAHNLYSETNDTIVHVDDQSASHANNIAEYVLSEKISSSTREVYFKYPPQDIGVFSINVTIHTFRFFIPESLIADKRQKSVEFSFCVVFPSYKSLYDKVFDSANETAFTKLAHSLVTGLNDNSIDVNSKEARYKNEFMQFRTKLRNMFNNNGKVPRIELHDVLIRTNY